MDKLIIKIEQQPSLKAFLTLDKISKMFRYSYRLSTFFNDSRISGPMIRKWNKDKSHKKVISFLKTYRVDLPSSYSEKVSSILKEFLLGYDTAESNFALKLNDDTNIFLEGDDECDLFLNIPWELAKGVPSNTSIQYQNCLSNTLAAFPFARRVNTFKSNFELRKKEKLLVKYCISDSENQKFIDVFDFDKIIKKQLEDRTSLLNFDSINGQEKFRPTFEEFRINLENSPPHILILVAHGKSDNTGSFLLFERWIETKKVAEIIKNNNRTYLVILLVCDQINQIIKTNKNSGVLSFLSCGIPSVIAMQNSIRAIDAGEFLEAILDSTLSKINIVQAVAAGRRKIGYHSNHVHCDWSFPTLFFTKDGFEKVEKYIAYIDNFSGRLEQLKRNIPRLPQIFDSEYDSKQLEDILLKKTGNQFIYGIPGVGKTYILTNVCRNLYTKWISDKKQNVRIIQYFDSEDYLEKLFNAEDLLSILKLKSRQVDCLDDNFLTIKWPEFRGNDNSSLTINLETLISFIDQNRLVLIFDQLDFEKTFFDSFVKKSAKLNNSLIIFVQHVLDNSCENYDSYHVKKLEISAIERIVNKLELECSPEELFELTGGISQQISNVIKKATQLKIPIKSLNKSDYSSESSIMKEYFDKLNYNQKYAMKILCHFPKGINQEFSNMLEFNWFHFLELSYLDLLMQEYKYGNTNRWLKLSQYLQKEFSNIYREEEDLSEWILEKFETKMNFEENQEQKLIELANLEGGLEFFLSIFNIYIKNADWEKAKGLATLLFENNYSRGEWYFQYILFTQIPEEHLDAEHLIKYAKSARMIGMLTLTKDILEREKLKNPNLGISDELDLLIEEAALLKDLNENGKDDLIEQKYRQVLDTIDTMMRESNEVEIDEIEIRNKKAITLFNKSIFRFWKKKEYSEAINDLEEAVSIFKQTNNEMMKNVSECEMVDMKINSNYLNQEELSGTLFQVEKYFSKTNNNSDRALANYRLGRLYNKLAQNSADDNKNFYYGQALLAYENASDFSKQSRNYRLKNIADSHIVEIKYYRDSEIDFGKIEQMISGIDSQFKCYKNDAWSLRCHRDLMRIKYLFLQKEHKVEMNHYKECLELSQQAPLNSLKGTDSKRCARILYEYLVFLQEKNYILFFDRTINEFRSQINAWLQKSYSNFEQAELLKDLFTFFN